MIGTPISVFSQYIKNYVELMHKKNIPDVRSFNLKLIAYNSNGVKIHNLKRQSNIKFTDIYDIKCEGKSDFFSGLKALENDIKTNDPENRYNQPMLIKLTGIAPIKDFSADEINFINNK